MAKKYSLKAHASFYALAYVAVAFCLAYISIVAGMLLKPLFMVTFGDYMIADSIRFVWSYPELTEAVSIASYLGAIISVPYCIFGIQKGVKAFHKQENA